ncbi:MULTISPECIES: EutP/PduV family microcompartment system protein [unclassified Jeotgalibaca]|uniref:EutP/PduV family microcompartment system protein n=1 Tax=unclassified Jeotgalibaca TaxID=2621505 RepID=UPI003FD482B4
MKKIMYIGSIGSGKTTLCQSILGEELKYNKTQAVEFYPQMIDTPGEFVQHRRFYSALQMMAAESEIIGLISSAIEQEMIFSPNFAQNMMRPCIGIVTKIDLCEDEKQIQDAEKRLQLAGVEKIFRVSAVTGEGMPALIDYLKGADVHANIHSDR